jgi:hypothetical protein
VGIDETRQERDVAEVTGSAGRVTVSDGQNSTAGDLDPTVLDRRSINRKQPAGL